MAADNEHDCPDPKEFLEETRQVIEKFGHQVLMVSGTDYSPPFAYSVGLFKTYKHPEIICFGLPQQLSGDIINDVAELIKGGERFKGGDISSEIFKNSKAAFLEVDSRNIADYFLSDIKYYEHANFPALQLVWTDRNDKFPWEDEFEEKFEFDQPLLDRNADFKFSEARNLCVFTTRQWLEEDKPILRVVHDNDGDWQFLTGDQMPDDIRLVALEQMTLKDPTLNEVFNLDYGKYAERDFVGGEWRESKREYNEEEDEIED